MNLLLLNSHFNLLLFMLLFIPLTEVVHAQESMTWKAGTARVNITPTQSMWMGGYASRDRPSEGVRQDIWAKALALQDLHGNRGVMIRMDLISIPKGPSDRIRNRLEKEYDIDRAQVILNASHTHTGPEIRPDSWNMEGVDRAKVQNYVDDLENKIVDLVGDALKSLKPARLYSGNGLTRFQVNRRNNVENELKSYTELNGPNDYAVPVIRITDDQDHLKAVLFGYACHPTVLSDYLISGDYPGYAQSTLEEMYPDVLALFFQGAGGDQNPLPRREPQLAEQYGRELAAAVDRVLKSEMKPLTADLKVSYSEVNIGMQDAPPSAEELKMIIADNSDYPGYLKQKAKVFLGEINSGKELMKNYPYPVQAWRLGDQAIFTLGGELLVGYAIELKRIFGDDIFVFGYTNDVMGYIPTVTVLREGGYEGNRSPYFTNPWEGNIEYLITQECQKLAKAVGIDRIEID